MTELGEMTGTLEIRGSANPVMKNVLLDFAATAEAPSVHLELGEVSFPPEDL